MPRGEAWHLVALLGVAIRTVGWKTSRTTGVFDLWTGRLTWKGPPHWGGPFQLADVVLGS